MNRFLLRDCPKCSGNMAVTIRQPEKDSPLQAVNDVCLRCRHRLGELSSEDEQSYPEHCAKARLNISKNKRGSFYGSLLIVLPPVSLLMVRLANDNRLARQNGDT
jgi:hypothetical protein